MTLVQPLTWTGILLSVVVPFPNSPLPFCPHVQTVPSNFAATACFHPLDTCLTWVRTLTGTGVWLLVNVPFPSWPWLLSPHDRSVLSDIKARLKSYPPVTAIATWSSPVTLTGTLLL